MGVFLQSNSFIKCLQFPVKQDKGAHIFLISRLTSLLAGLPSSALACIVSSLRLNLCVPSLTAELFAAICLFSAQACRWTMAPMLATVTLACLGIKTAIVHIFFYIQLQNVSKCVHALGLGLTCSVAWPQFSLNFLSATFRWNFFPVLPLFTVNLFVLCGFSHHPLLPVLGKHSFKALIFARSLLSRLVFVFLILISISYYVVQANKKTYLQQIKIKKTHLWAAGNHWQMCLLKDCFA